MEAEIGDGVDDMERDCSLFAALILSASYY